jgi:ELWxxDGT repeat protein
MKKYLALLFCVVTFYTNAQQTISDWKHQKDFSSNPQNFVKAGKKIYFLATTPEHGRELWVTEGTTESTKIVKDIMVGENGAFTDPYTTFSNVVALESGTMYFIANDNPNENAKIWVTDGTEAGTKIYKNEVKGTLFYTGDELVEYVIDIKEGKFNIYHQDAKKDVSLMLGTKTSISIISSVKYINNNLLTITAFTNPNSYIYAKNIYVATIDLKAMKIKVEPPILNLQDYPYQSITSWKGDVYFSKYILSPNYQKNLLIFRMNANASKIDTLFNGQVQDYDDDAFSRLIASQNELLLNFNNQVYSLQKDTFIKKDDPKSYKIAFIVADYFHPNYDAKNDIMYNFINAGRQMNVRAIRLSDGSLIQDYIVPNTNYSSKISSNLIKIYDPNGISYQPRGLFDFVKEQPKELSHEISWSVEMDDKLFFGGYSKNEKKDSELYILDNQSFDIKLLKNINTSGIQKSKIENTMFNGKFVQVYSGEKGIMLGISDGTKTGTKEVKMLVENTDINVLSYGSFKEANQRLGILVITRDALDNSKGSVFCFSVNKNFDDVKTLISSNVTVGFNGISGYPDLSGGFSTIPNQPNVLQVNINSKISQRYISDLTNEGTIAFSRNNFSSSLNYLITTNQSLLLSYNSYGGNSNENNSYLLKYNLKTFKADTVQNTKGNSYPIIFDNKIYYYTENDKILNVYDGTTNKKISGINRVYGDLFFKANNTTFIMRTNETKSSIIRIDNNFEATEIWSEIPQQGRFIHNPDFLKTWISNGKTYFIIGTRLNDSNGLTKSQVLFYELKADNTLQKISQIDDVNASRDNFAFSSMKVLSKGLSYIKRVDSKLVFYVMQDDFVSKEVYKSIANDSFSEYNDRETKKTQFYFMASGSIFVSDGSVEGSKILIENNLVIPENSYTYPVIHPIDSLGNRFYFTLLNSNDKAMYGTNLWITDGTKAGTVQLLNQKYVPKPYINEPYDGEKKELVGILGNKYFFRKNNDTDGNIEMWVTEGTVATTRKLLDSDKKPVGVFFANSLYSSDNNIFNYPYYAYQMSKLFKIGNKLYFTKQSSSGYEPWETDGTPEGTKMMGDLVKGIQSSNPYQFVELNQKPYLIATEENKSLQLWSFCQPKASFVADKIAPNTTEEVKLIAPQNNEYKYQWLKDKKEIDKANANNYIATTSGTYQLKVEDLIGCTNISDSLVINFTQKILANEPFTDSFGLKIYPNPSQNDLNLIFESNHQGNFEATLYDVTGKIMVRQSVNSKVINTISTQQLNTGMYFLRLTNGEQQTIQKVIKN